MADDKQKQADDKNSKAAADDIPTLTSSLSTAAPGSEQASAAKGSPLTAARTAPKTPPKTAQVKAQRGAWFINLLVFIALLCSAGASLVAYKLWMDRERDTSSQLARMSALEAAEGSQRKALADLENALAVQSQAEQRSSKQNAERMVVIDETLQNISAQLKLLAKNSTDEWVLAEAAYLLRLANHRVLMSRDTAGTRQLLEAADQLILRVNDVSLYTVREAIAKDIATLDSIEHIDRTGIYSRLNAMSQQIADLPLYVPTTKQSSAVDEHGVRDYSQLGWVRRVVAQTKDALANFAAALSIRYRDFRVEPLLPPEQDFYLRQNLRLMIEQAKSALLAGEQEIYLQSLGNARAWIGQYFQLSEGITTAMLENIDNLMSIQVVYPAPDISESSRALTHYIENYSHRDNQPPPANVAPGQAEGS